MTDRDSRTSSGGSASDGSLEGATPTVAVEVSAGGVEQVHQGLAAMIAGDVGMQVLPNALDAVRVRAIGRQEMEYDAATESGEGLAGSSRLVDAVVVDDQVDAVGVSVPARDQPEQLTEQRCILAGRAGRVQVPGAHVEGSGQVELLVVARCDDPALMATQHPIATDLRVEMDVDLVAVEHGLLGAGSRFQPANRRRRSMRPIR